MVKDENSDKTTLFPNIKNIKFLSDDFNPNEILDKTPKLNALVLKACNAKNQQELVSRLEVARDYIKETPSALETKDITGNTPLIVSAQSQKPQVSAILLYDGADINAQDKHGDTSLHHFINHGCDEGVKLFLNKGADLSKVNNSGQNALHIAASNINNNKEADSEDPNITQQIIAKSKDLEAKDGEGRTAAELAYMYGNSNTLKILLDSGAKAPDTSKVKFDGYVNSKKKWVTENILRSSRSMGKPEESKEESGNFVDSLKMERYAQHHHRSHHMSDYKPLPRTSMKVYIKKTRSSRAIDRLFEENGEEKTNCR